MKKQILFLIILIFTGCAGNRVLQNVPPFKDTLPEITTGFYSVHKIINGVTSEERGTDFLGDFVYLYKDDIFIDGNYFSGIKGSFLPNNFIKTRLENSNLIYYWVNAENEDTTGSIDFKIITENRLVAVFTTDINQKEEVELKFYRYQIWNDEIKTIPIAHRGICYQPPGNHDGIFPANTGPGFEAALRSGYGGFELDVRVTKDNRFVVSHDEDLSVATTVHGKVKEKNLYEFENVLVVQSAAIPENKATAKQAYIAAPIVSLDKVLKHFIDDPRLKTIVVDIKPDTDERIIAAAKHDFKDFTIEQQKKVLFLTREENTGKLLRELCPYSDIGLEGSIGPEPIKELEKYYPEAVGLPRGAHNSISFGANILLAFKSIETSLKMINKAMELSREYDYKICMWTFAKEWRFNFLRENEIFPDFILSDVPYYQYALQQMRYIDEKDIQINDKKVIAKKYKNPIYKRAYKEYVRDFWFRSRTLAELTYGVGKPNQYYFKNNFASVGNFEFKLGRSELNKFNITNVELNELYLFYSLINSNWAISDVGTNEITTKAIRFGIGSTDGFGYDGSTISFIPYVAQAFTWTKLKDFSDSIKPGNSENSSSDFDVLNRYWGTYRFGDRALYGMKFDIRSSLQLDVNYETAIIYPRHLFWNWAGSYAISQIGYSVLSHYLGKLVDDEYILAPIINTLVRAGYLYGYYLLREKNMNWPFSTEAPLRYEMLNFGISLVL